MDAKLDQSTNGANPEGWSERSNNSQRVGPPLSCNTRQNKLADPALCKIMSSKAKPSCGPAFSSGGTGQAKESGNQLPAVPDQDRDQAPPMNESDKKDKELAIEDARVLGVEAFNREASRTQVAVPTFLHAWVVIDSTPGCWRCVQCGTVANTGQPSAPSQSGCPGWPTAAAMADRGHSLLKYRPKGHELATAYACASCHKTSTGQSNFDEPCDSMPTVARSRGFNRLENGKHPHARWGNPRVYGAGDWVHTSHSER